MATDPFFSVFDPKRNLSPDETDKAIRTLYGMMRGTQRREAWPIGSIFITVSNENPADILGYGEWIPFGNGRIIMSTNSSVGAAERTG